MKLARPSSLSTRSRGALYFSISAASRFSAWPCALPGSETRSPGCAGFSASRADRQSAGSPASICAVADARDIGGAAAWRRGRPGGAALAGRLPPALATAVDRRRARATQPDPARDRRAASSSRAAAAQATPVARGRTFGADGAACAIDCRRHRVGRRRRTRRRRCQPLTVTIVTRRFSGASARARLIGSLDPLPTASSRSVQDRSAW